MVNVIFLEVAGYKIEYLPLLDKYINKNA